MNVRATGSALSVLSLFALLHCGDDTTSPAADGPGSDGTGSSGSSGAAGSSGSSGSPSSDASPSASSDGGTNKPTPDGSPADGAPGKDAGKSNDGSMPSPDGGGTFPSDASTSGGTLCTTQGWCQLTGTKIRDVCPNPSPGGYCEYVVSAWSGAASDTTHDILYVWGGGHTDYDGNEMYALDLTTVKMKRLNDPSPPSAVTDCSPLYSDGLPASRHTYDGLTYFAPENAVYAFGGSVAKCGGLQNDTLRFSVGTLAWKQRHNGGPMTTAPGFMTDYDTVTQKIYIHDSNTGIYSYDPVADQFTTLNTNGPVDYHMTGRIDPGRRLFVMMGGNMIRAVSLAQGSTYDVMNWDAQTSGCDALKNISSPGLTYDSNRNVLVGWAGGSDIYLFDATTKTCTKQTYPGGPAAAQQYGTFGRFRYFPNLDVYAVVNDIDQDAYTLRLP
jgi:hypothetical protein